MTTFKVLRCESEKEREREVQSYPFNTMGTVPRIKSAINDRVKMAPKLRKTAK